MDYGRWKIGSRMELEWDPQKKTKPPVLKEIKHRWLKRTN
jgi:hypothetical protein